MTKECHTVDEVRKELSFGRMLSLCSPSIMEFMELQKPTSVQEMATLIQDLEDTTQRSIIQTGRMMEESMTRQGKITRPTHSQQMNSNYYKSEFGEGPRQNHDGAQRWAFVTCYLCKKKQDTSSGTSLNGKLPEWAATAAEACSSCQAK